jgi:NAD(P)H-hydrate epimerase
MKPVFTFTEIRDIEKQIIEKENFPSIVLMENAGKNSFDIIKREFPELTSRQLFIFCGKGNNAGDGYTLARHLSINNIDFRVVAIEDPSALKGDALINFDTLLKCSQNENMFLNEEDFVKGLRSFSKDSKFLIIDALLGTGISGELSEKYSNAIALINSLRNKFKKSRVVSLDIPSGLMSGQQTNPMVMADVTISMGTMKTEILYGVGKENSGDVFVVPIGVTDSLISKYDTYRKSYVSAEDVSALMPKRRKTSHKYSNGKLLVIGGSKGLSGAVVMSSLSAIKSGAGGVAAAIPASISRILGKKHFDIMRQELEENDEGSIKGDSFEQIIKRMKWADTILLGPGISISPDTKKFVFDVITKSEKNIVIDADALTLIASEMSVLLYRKNDIRIILTPHIGEFARLCRKSADEIQLNRFEMVREFASGYGVNVVLKSETTLSCTTDGEIFVNSTGNQSLAEAGSGDVLSGIIASLFAQTGDAKTAMICGNYLHGLCADLYSAQKGNKQSASPVDILKMIPEAVSFLLHS